MGGERGEREGSCGWGVWVWVRVWVWVGSVGEVGWVGVGSVSEVGVGWGVGACAWVRLGGVWVGWGGGGRCSGSHPRVPVQVDGGGPRVQGVVHLAVVVRTQLTPTGRWGDKGAGAKELRAQLDGDEDHSTIVDAGWV